VVSKANCQLRDLG